MTGGNAATQKALEFIARSENPDQLRTIAENAQAAGNEEVRIAAQRRLYAV